MTKVKYGLKEKRREALLANLEELKKRLSLYKPKKVLLFGSLARDQVHSRSDLDLLIIKKEVPKRFLDRLEEAYALLSPAIDTDLLVYTPEEIEKLKEKNPFIKRVLKEGIVIYEE